MSPLRPKTLGTCRIDDLLAQGGMAEVYRGYQEPLERPVAIKALLPERKDEPEAIERFRREALALATLHHQNIVAVHDLVEKHGRFYLVMEYVDGLDLATVLEAGPVPVDIALLIGSELASALEHAHFRRVIHRDVKPSNIMLSRQGQVKLTDFGIAKFQAQGDLTRKGYIVGTLHYLSPEQVGGAKADARSDLYSLGVTLFEVLAGELPYEVHEDAESQDLLAAILNGRQRRLRSVAPGLPRQVERVLQQCLAPNPTRRYQRAADLRRDLDQLLGAVLKGTRSARLMSFLKERGYISQADETQVASEELRISVSVEKPETALKSITFDLDRQTVVRRAGSLAVVVVLTIIVLLGAMTATSLLAPHWTQTRLERLTAWFKDTTESGRPIDGKTPAGAQSQDDAQPQDDAQSQNDAKPQGEL